VIVDRLGSVANFGEERSEGKFQGTHEFRTGLRVIKVSGN